MFYQKEYVRENVAMTLNATYVQELPKQGLLSSLLIRITGSMVSGYGVGGGDWRIVDKISKIELLGDGATVIKSIRGDQLQALGWYDQWVAAPDHISNYATQTQRFYALINFGRRLYDPLLGLDLSRYRTVEIKVTTTAVATDFSDLTISLLGYYLRDVATRPWLGYLRTEEWKNWTTVANETRYHELPVEHFLRRIMLQAIPAEDANNIDKTTMENLMSDIDLSLDTGIVRVFKGGIDDLMRENLWDYNSYVLTGGSVDTTAGKGVRTGIGYAEIMVPGAGSQKAAASATVPTIEAAHTGPTLVTRTREGDQPLQFIAKGVGYHNTAMLRFDQDEDPANWLDPSKRRTVLLNILTANLTAAASGRNAIVLDRLVRY